MAIPDISIIIPSYNAALQLSVSLGSALAQTHNNIEIIVVDDCSTDNTSAVAAELAAGDTRVNIVWHEVNKGEGLSRKTGAEAASGRYLLFLDADDELAPQACELLFAEMQRAPVDILQFGMEVAWHGTYDEVVATHMERFLAPPHDTYYGQELMRTAFGAYEVNWNIAGKLFEASVCKRAFAEFPEDNFPLGADMLTYFLVCRAAHSYRGYPDVKLYTYHYGAGGCNNNEMVSLEAFRRRWIKTMDIATYIEQALRADASYPYSDEAVSFVREHFLGESIHTINVLVEPSAKAAAFSELRSLYSDETVIAFLVNYFWFAPKNASELFFGTDVPPSLPQREGRMAWYTAQITVPHASLSAGQFWLFESSLSAPDAAELSRLGVEAHALQSRYPAPTAASWPVRAKAFEELVSSHRITTLVVVDYMSELIFWDTLYLHTLGVTVLSQNGEPLMPLLVEGKSLAKVLKAGGKTKRQHEVLMRDLSREQLGRNWALASYREQTRNQVGVLVSRAYKLGRALTWPLRLARGLLQRLKQGRKNKA